MYEFETNRGKKTIIKRKRRKNEKGQRTEGSKRRRREEEEGDFGDTIPVTSSPTDIVQLILHHLFVLQILSPPSSAVCFSKYILPRPRMSEDAAVAAAAAVAVATAAVAVISRR